MAEPISATSGNTSMEGIMNAEREQSERLFVLQAQQNMQTEESTAKTNMEKSRHDAMMAVISNFKS